MNGILSLIGTEMALLSSHHSLEAIASGGLEGGEASHPALLLLAWLPSQVGGLFVLPQVHFASYIRLILRTLARHVWSILSTHDRPHSPNRHLLPATRTFAQSKSCSLSGWGACDLCRLAERLTFLERTDLPALAVNGAV